MISNRWWLLLIPVAALLLPVAWLLLQSQLARRPDDLGTSNGRLRPCPESPNCVSTQAESSEHKMEPLVYAGTADDALDRIGRIIEAMPGARTVTREGDYLHAEFTSRWFRFVDDVEFLVDREDSVVHFRSASRVGYSDLGANRARMEHIARRFSADSAAGGNDLKDRDSESRDSERGNASNGGGVRADQATERPAHDND